MKKFLLLLAVVALWLPAMADDALTASITFSDKYTENTPLDGVTIDLDKNVSVTFAKANGQVAPQYYTNGTAVRLYGGNTMTVTASGKLSRIVITYGSSDGTNEIKADGMSLENGNTWTGSEPTVTFAEEGTSGNRRIAALTVTYWSDGSTPEPGPGGDEEPDQPGENVVQAFTQGLGFIDGSSNSDALSAENQYTASNTGIEYTAMGCYANNGYLMVNGKNYSGAFISWSLDFPMSQLVMKTSGGCSTNPASTVNVYAGETLIGNYPVNVQNAEVTVVIPEGNQAAGTVYKVESATDSYNQQFASFTYVRAGNEGETPEPGPGPEVPDAPEGVITVAEAIDLISKGYTGEATVKGIVSQVDSFNTSYGSITYWISDDGATTAQMQVYGGLGLDGEKFTAKEDLALGAKVTVKGEVKDYNGTPEFNLNSVLLSYEDPEGPGPEQPAEPEGEKATFLFDEPNTLGLGLDTDDPLWTAGGDYSFAESSIEADGVVVSFSGQSELTNTDPRLYNSNGNIDLRIYKGESFNVTAPENYCLLQINFTKAGGNFDMEAEGTFKAQGNSAVWDPDTGLDAPVSPDDEGEYVSEVTFNIINTTRISTMTVYYKKLGTTGVPDFEAADGEAVYYNLQGLRVQHPDRGIYIKVSNGKTEKLRLP